MKATAINGSTRKGCNTDILFQQVSKSASDAGAQTELIQLSDFTFSGCRSCFARKKPERKPGDVCGKTIYNRFLTNYSQLTVFMGSLIYLGNVPGMMNCFMERLVPSLLSYNDYSKKLFRVVR